MQVVCERQNRTEEAARFADLAKRCWPKADAGRMEEMLASLRTTRKATTAAQLETSR
jgi:hypothetical protein